MPEKLLDISTGKLLEKFGAGNHKPGSGSASAFQGMLAAQMLRTVIDLTLDPKRKKNYQKYIVQLLDIRKRIDENIYPSLERLFQLDSEQFDNVIKIRTERDNEKELPKKKALILAAQEALVISTDTPLDIADLCLELIGLAEYVFNNGFKSARGDSGVAINCAVSGVASCLSIVELNLTTLPFSPKTEAIRQRKERTKSKYENHSNIVSDSLIMLEKESTLNRIFLQSISSFQKGNLEETISSNSDIERLVRQLQNTLWLQRNHIWKKNSVNTPIDILRADKVLEKIMGYSYQTHNSLGVHEQDGELFEIAGLINKNDKIVQVSRRLPLETQNFTAAHELGHAVLHKQTVLHRDKPLDGSSTIPKSREEMQADKFATFFLMPAKLVEEFFFEIFETDRFTINESSVLAIKGGSIVALKNKCQNKRGLARLLATTEYYGGKAFNSLSKIFKVSTETMAIRLEELDLLDF